MKYGTFFLRVSGGFIFTGIGMLVYALLNPPMLSLIGFGTSIVTIGVGTFCIWLWYRKVDVKSRKMFARLNESGYLLARQVDAPLSALKFWYRWKRNECAQYHQFWAMLIWIMYCGFISIVSMYLASLPAPCVDRNDCQVTQSRGVYIGE